MKYDDIDVADERELMLWVLRAKRQEVLATAAGLSDEHAHHAGHADSTREMLDGTKMRG